MNRYRNAFSAVAMIAALVFSSAVAASAQHRNEKEVRDAVRTLNSKLDDFEANLRYQMQANSSGGGQFNVSDDIREMRGNLRKFEDNIDRHRENRDDVSQIVDVARSISDFLVDNPQNRLVTDNWQEIRRQLDRLASNYGVTNDWDAAVGNGKTSRPQRGNSGSQSDAYDPPAQNVPSPYNKNTVVVGLSGTYDLDRQRSESVDDIITSSGAAGTEQREDLKEKLTAPPQIAIDIRGTQVTMATSTSTPIVFTADGREKVENTGGRTIRLRATLSGDKLVISSLGGETDYTITFTSVSDGQVMKVSRRITTDYLDQTVFAESVYNKTDAVAKLGIPANSSATNNSGGSVDNNTGSPDTTTDPNGGYSDNDQGGTIANGGTGSNNSGNNNGGTVNPNGGYGSGRRSAPAYVKPGNYTIPDGTMITGILENEVNTKFSHNNDRFRMTVQSPNEFRGAVVEGYLTNVQRSGKVSGTSSVTFNFDKITLRDGQSYDFAGTLRNASDPTGKIAKVDNEGTVRGDSQTRNTAKRGGIGAGIGAIIGAIAGGGSGAAIGAIIGGGAGAGSVALQDRQDVKLEKGATLSVQSAGPSK